MKVTVDANILFACLIKPGLTRKIWFNPELQLFAPKFIITEFLKYKKTLQKKFGEPSYNFNKLLDLIISQLHLILDNELKPYLPAAASLCSDSKDWLYLACALKENTLLWTNDSMLKKQNRVKVKATDEMAKEFGLL